MEQNATGIAEILLGLSDVNLLGAPEGVPTVDVQMYYNRM